VAEIAERLRHRDPATAGASLDHGAGISLFFAYHGAAAGGDGDRDMAVRFIEGALEQSARAERTFDLYGGYLGVGWTLAHLEGRLLDLGEDDPNDSLDRALLDLLGRPWPGDFGLSGGLVGIGVYALERLPRAGAAELLGLVVARLAELAVSESGSLTWRTVQALLAEDMRADHPHGLNDLGVAHGAAGVIAFLGRAHTAAAAAGPLLDDAVAWLLDQRLPAGAGSVFPYFVGADVEPEPARAAWCYGDPGIAAGLLAAGRAASESGWVDEAMAIARHAASRPAADCGVTEPTLCHGAAGLGHIYNRLYQLTGDDLLGDAARAWFARVLNEELPTHDGLLTGSAGIGLALIAATADVAPDWDAVLLLPR
jgi:hypothetical protein